MKATQVLILAIAVLALSLAPISTRAQPENPEGAIILVMNLDPSQNYRVVDYGTGFLVDEDGIAVTNSHVVYPTAHDYRYMVAAVVGKEMYRAEIICASSLDYDPLKGRPLQYHRDVARIRLQPWVGPGGSWSWVRGDPDLTYTLHREELPKFHALTIETYTPSGHVHSIGYGKVSAYPRLHRSEGSVTATGSLSDGTPYIRLDMSQPAQSGDSGSPILDDQERVVGVFTWEDHSDARLRWAQGAVATQSCGR